MSSITRQGVRLEFKNNYEIHGVNDEKSPFFLYVKFTKTLVYYYKILKHSINFFY